MRPNILAALRGPAYISPELAQGWEEFRTLLAFWMASNKYVPPKVSA